MKDDKSDSLVEIAVVGDLNENLGEIHDKLLSVPREGECLRRCLDAEVLPEVRTEGVLELWLYVFDEGRELIHDLVL